MSARVCEIAEMNINNNGKGYIFKDAQFEVGVEVRDNEHDKTGNVPRRKVSEISVGCYFSIFMKHL